MYLRGIWGMRVSIAITLAVTIILLTSECAAYALASPAAEIGAGPLKSPRACSFPGFGEAFMKKILPESAGAFQVPSLQLFIPAWESSIPHFSWFPNATPAATPPAYRNTGILTGKVTVGPLTPVERVGVPPLPDPAVFTGRKLIVYAADGRTKVADVPIKAAGYYGTYSISLPAGNYVLDTVHQGIGHASPLPKQVAIEAGKTTVVDVDFDTGIR